MSPVRGCSPYSATASRQPHLTGRFHTAFEPGRLVAAGKRGAVAEFNSYGARRGNYEVMIRGTFQIRAFATLSSPVQKAA